MGCFTPYENFKTLTTNDLQFHSPIRFNQSGPGMPVSKITFHAYPYQTGLQPVLQWKVQTFPRTVHTAPHHTTFCGLQPWKVIFVSHFPVFLISHIRNPIALPRTFCSTSDTSGRKTPSQTLLSPYVSHLETADLPHSPLQATFPFFRCVISGANTALHTVFPPEVSHQEQTHHCTQLFLLIYYIGKPATCSRAHSRPHSHFSDVLHQERKHPCTRLFLLIHHIGNDDEDDGE